MTEKISGIESPIGHLSICERMTEDDIGFLLHYAATDKTVRAFTSDASRFANRESYDTWIKNVEGIYTLKNQKGNMVGIIWFEALPLEDPRDKEQMDVTFGIRTYGEARGKHLARKFMEEAFPLFKSQDYYRNLRDKRVWLKTSQDNLPAVTAYEEFGFEKVGDPDEKGKILMILNG